MILLIIGPWAALRFGILEIALQQFDGNILGPKILGDSTGLRHLGPGGYRGGRRALRLPGMLLGVPTLRSSTPSSRELVNAKLKAMGIDGSGKRRGSGRRSHPRDKTE